MRARPFLPQRVGASRAAAPTSGRWRSVASIVVCAVAIGIAIGITPARFGPEWSVDAEHNLDRARALLAGASLYDDWYFYTPLAALATVPALAVPETLSLLLWAGAKLALLAGVLAWSGREPLRLLVGLVFIPLIGDTAIGNVNAVIAAAVLLAVHGHGVLLGVVLATAPKPLVVPFLIWLFVHRRRTALRATATAVGLSVIGVLLLGMGQYVEYLASLRTAGQYVGEPWNQSVPVVAIALLVLFVASIRDERRGLGSALALGVAASPYVGVYTGTVLVSGPFGPVALAVVSVASLGLLPWATAAVTAALYVDVLRGPARRIKGRLGVGAGQAALRHEPWRPQSAGPPDGGRNDTRDLRHE